MTYEQLENLNFIDTTKLFSFKNLIQAYKELEGYELIVNIGAFNVLIKNIKLDDDLSFDEEEYLQLAEENKEEYDYSIQSSGSWYEYDEEPTRVLKGKEWYMLKNGWDEQMFVSEDGEDIYFTNDGWRELVQMFVEDMEEEELIEIHNEMCTSNYRDGYIYRNDGYIYRNDDYFIDEYLEGLKAKQVLLKVVYGDYNFHEDFVIFNGCGNLVSSDNCHDFIEISEVVDFVVENEIEI